MSINTLLNTLHSIVPLSMNFRAELTSVIKSDSLIRSQEILGIGHQVNFTLFILSGTIKGTVLNQNGKEMVVRLYSAGAFVTDIAGFFENKPAHIKLTVVNYCEVLILKRADYLRLEKYPETEKIKSHIMLREKEIDFNRAILLSYKYYDRFTVFSDLYPMYRDIPNRCYASFLNIHETDFCRAKYEYLKEK